MFFKILKFVLWFLLLILIIGGILLFFNVRAIAQSVEYDFSGWIWSDNFGWISLNSANCQDLSGGTCEIPFSGPVEYGVKLSSDNALSGYGWSETVGWVCFGATCPGIVPAGGPAYAQLDELSGKIEGWAKIIGLDNNGWIKLGRGAQVSGSYLGEDCYDCEKKCLLWTQNCYEIPGEPPQTICEDVEPCIEYSATEYENCASCFTQTCFGESVPSASNDLPDSYCPPNHQWPTNGGDPVVGGSQYICYGQRNSGGPNYSCENCCTSCQRSPLYGDDYRIVCDTCPYCEYYGVNSDVSSGQLLGWSWSGDDAGKIGAGWIHYNLEQGSSFIVYPWLETDYGSIYTTEDVRQRAGVDRNNATYCIFADDIKHVSSFNCERRFIDEVDVGFPSLSSGQVYRNALGNLDFEGLSNYQVVGERKFNKYGNEVVEISSLSEPMTLNGKVYVANGNLSISSGLSFNNGGENSVGDGIFVVKGDLFINAGFDYNNSAELPDDLSKLASVAWLVEGDVVIDPNVEKVVGAFIVLGRSGSNCFFDNGDACDDNQEYPHYTQNGYGIFFSGQSQRSLTIFGMVAAKAFDFGRVFADPFRGSEKIIYDGRLIANPPPGLKGFVEGLPIIRDFAY